MGKVLGIVGEYNPFHNGHLYHLEQSKKMTSSNYTVAIMGGNFTQRGSTSLIDKWSKAEAAIQNGIDLVIELPVLYTTSSAENFADGAIKILDSLKIYVQNPKYLFPKLFQNYIFLNSVFVLF